MATYLHRPTLNEKMVERALEAMRVGQALCDNPLQFFLSILNRLEAPHVLSGDAAVQVATFGFLAETITEHLERFRRLYRLSPPDRSGLNEDLQKDFRQGNTELEAWSLLYHRYVCVEQDFSMQNIAALVNQNERTLRRRHKLGLTRLTWALIEREQQARQAESRRRLRLALPCSSSPVLLGADSSLAAARHVLLEMEAPHHLVLHGAAGIGKTALALALAHNLIDSEPELLSDLLWLDAAGLPVTPAALVLEIVTRLGLSWASGQPPEQVLRAYVYARPVLLIFDGAENLLSEPPYIEALLASLDSAYVVLTSRIKAPAHLWLSQITIPELSREDAFTLLDCVAAEKFPRPNQFLEHFDAVWQSVGGNPLALKLLGALPHLPLAVALKHVEINHLYQQAWDHLSEQERRIWLLPLLFPGDGISYDLIQELVDLPPESVNRALDALVNAALLTVHTQYQVPYYSVQPVAVTFLVEHIRQGLLLSQDEAAAHFVQGVLTRQTAYLVDHPSAVLAVQVLKLARDLALPGDVRWKYAYDLAPQITLSGLWQTWAEHLTSLLAYEAHSPARQAWLNLMAGTARRWLGQLDEAKTCLRQALHYYQQDSVERADTLIEWSVVCRYQGQWDEAHRSLQSALGIYMQSRQSAGTDRCVYELSQLALESNSPAQTLEWLSKLGVWSARAWGIASQAYLQMERLDDALQAAEQASEQLPPQHPNQGRAVATLGQIYDALGRSDLAVTYLMLAVDLLDSAKDMIGYARACNNLAVAYIKQPIEARAVASEEIDRLLTRALRIQEHIGDELGMAVSRQNLTWLASVQRN